MKNILSGVCITLMVLSCTTQNEKMNYPIAQKSNVVDNYFGTAVPDPYRWMEDDQSLVVKKWVNEERTLTSLYLSKIPLRDSIRNRMTELWDYPTSGAPMKKGNHYFVFRNNGKQNQSVLYVLDKPKDLGEVLLDPNLLSTDGTTSLAEMSFSKDGKYLAYTISQSGSDWREAFVIDVASKKTLPDQLNWIKFSALTWYKDGFFYSRYPTPQEGEALKGENMNCMVYYHKLGDKQDKDQLIFQDKKNPSRGFGTSKSDDDNYLFITATESTHGNALYAFKMGQFNKAPQVIIPDFTDNYFILDCIDGKFYILTDHKASNSRLIAIDPKNMEEKNWKDIIPEQKESLTGVNYVGGTLFASYLKDAHSVVKRYKVDGSFESEIAFPVLGTVGGFGGDKADSITYYSISSFVIPSSIYEYHIASGKSTLFETSKIKFNAQDYETKQVFYTSKDGTKVPMFIVAKKGLKLDGTNPTLLYGYGGFDVSLTPTFSPRLLPWLEMGGVYAMANLRGGGEYGAAWHEAGTKMNKKNVFNDFIAAGEYLIAQKYTSKEKLAIQGGSNGGLLIGACVNMRPDLFRVAIPMVGVMDMLRYQDFTIGRYWASDYGTSKDSKEMFNYLYSYSPLHTIKEGVEYPAIMVTTADHDDRVVPAHSFKYAATLQAKYKGNRPMLIRINSKAGHGAGKPKSMIIDEYSDIWAFILFNMQ